MHDLPLLINISIALAAAFVGGLFARRVKLPAIVGYLLAGIAIGPFTPGFVGDTDTISQLAELGVIFLMFGVGLHFSFSDLWKVRKIAVPGAILQMILGTLAGYVLSQLWGWSSSAGITMGLGISIASTVVLLRGLMDNNLLNTPHGRVAVGWLVLEDLATVLILILMPALAPQSGAFALSSLGLTLLKAGAFVVLMFLVGKRFIPWLLDRMAHTRSRELFILAILVITLATALGASEIFSVSLALGAFVAGAIVSESPLSHQVGADVLPFREAFAVLFFVSVGMLVNPIFLVQHLGQVFVLTLVVVLGKILINLLIGFLIPGQAKTFMVVAAGLSQIGEFTFIVGQAGLMLGLLDRNQYSLILAAALLSITVNPWMFKLIPKAEQLLKGIPWIWKRLDRHAVPETSDDKPGINPVVLVGYGRVGGHLLSVLRSMDIPVKVIEADVELVEMLNNENIPVLYGDAANSEVLTHAHLEHAKALVVSVPEEAATELIVSAAHDTNPNLPIIARAATEEGIHRLTELGASFVVHPELEGGLEMVRHTLLELGLPRREVDEYAEQVRTKRYEAMNEYSSAQPLVRNILRAIGEIEISWIEVPDDSPLVGHTLAESDLRGKTGASVVALVRDQKLNANPKSSTMFQAGDRIGIIGDTAQIFAVEAFLLSGE
ncbi:MAG TPA: cation:proton antiporter [Anaerolineales bacterium]|nr:cation:proton antiporter [Anaerolineales bacterium]HRQ92637.1 cation:proton antiporter [Anaerolineales bacterium]